MPKIKTRKSASKRFKTTKNGKLKRSAAYKRHLLTHKSAKRRRNLRGTTLVADADFQRVKHMMPYG